MLVADESRFGLKTLLSRRLVGPGVKPLGKHQHLFQAQHLYGAFDVQTGESFYLESNSLSHQMFSQFLFHIAEHYPGQLVVILVDNAGFHRANDLECPDNVVLLFQPPYSPDLNPSERVWQECKRALKGLIFPTLNKLSQFLEQILQRLTTPQIRSLVQFPWLMDALKQVSPLLAN